MGESSAITWTGGTWNPWIGCHKVSPGCTHCYAQTWTEKKLRANFDIVHRTKPDTFSGPLRWRNVEPPLVFTCSLSDFFIEEADPWRAETWEIIKRTPHLTYQILTKRPERIVDHLPSDWSERGYPNVWLGTSIELQEPFVVKRLPALLAAPAKVHFVSAEPLLGPVRFGDYLGPQKVNWVIVGGESGYHNRKMDPSWATAIRDECKGAGVPFFFKQWGGARDKRDGKDALLDGQLQTAMPHFDRVLSPSKPIPPPPKPAPQMTPLEAFG